MKTKFKKDHHGWNAETFVTINDQDYEITTYKRHTGKLTTCFMPVTLSNNAAVISFDTQSIFKEQKELISEKLSRVTEQAVKDQHYKALAKFEELAETGNIQPKKKETPEIGTILFLDGYEGYKGSPGNSHVVYDIETTNFGINYKTVEIDTLKLSIKSHVKPFSKKFGIGTYFEMEYKFEGSQDDLNNLIIDAKQKEEKENNKEEAAELMRAQIRAAKVEEGKKLVNVPNNVKSVITANLIQDESDLQTDYFAESTARVIYLDFSTHSRDLFSEMRKACLNSDVQDVKDLATPAEVNNNGETKKEYVSNMAKYYDGDQKKAGQNWHPEDEHREKYSMGRGYYLMKGYSRSGWRVEKQNFNIEDQRNLEKLYIAAAEGRYFIPGEKEPVQKDVFHNDLELINYSEKSFAIIGNTKPIKETLKNLGGKFNYRLKCGAGWIFSKKKEEDVRRNLNI